MTLVHVAVLPVGFKTISLTSVFVSELATVIAASTVDVVSASAVTVNPTAAQFPVCFLHREVVETLHGACP